MPVVAKPPRLRILSPGAPVDEEGASPKSVTELSVDGAHRPNDAKQQPDGLAARLKRQRAHLEDADQLIPCERHPLNRGKKPCHHTGLRGKLYNRHDIVTPIIDSMILMHYKLGWQPLSAAKDTFLTHTLSSGAFTTAASAGPDCSGSGRLLQRCESNDDHLHALGYGPAPSPSKAPLCRGCSNDNVKNFSLNKDKEHVCNVCGAVSSSLRVSTHREKACTEEEDKTTHADKPYESRTDRFDHPAQSCDELRQQREREATGSRISKKAKAKYGLGWSQEHAAREAARAERERADMDASDLTKGQHIQIALDRLFTPLEPLDNRIKRFCRMEADRAWREAVRHRAICCTGTKCPLRIKEKGPAVIADAALSCCIATLLEGEMQLDGVTHAALMVVANKLGAQQIHKGTPLALRAVRTVVATLLSHTGTEPLPTCPLPRAGNGLAKGSSTGSPCNPSPVSCASSSGASSGVALSLPFHRVDSSVSDCGEPASRLLQLRDAISAVHKALGTASSGRTRDGTLVAIQNAEFRCALDIALENDDDVGKLSIEALAFALMSAVSQQADAVLARRERRSVPATLIASFKVSIPRLDAAIASLTALLPPPRGAVDDDDDLFQ